MTCATSRPWYVVALLIPLAISTGCDGLDDLVRPPEDLIEGVDLMVEEITVAEAVFVPEYQRLAVPAGRSIEITVKVRNRGTETSEQAELEVCVNDHPDSCVYPLASSTVTLPPIRSNQRETRLVTLSLPMDQSANPGAVRARIHIVDRDHANNVETLPLRVERPNLVAELQLISAEVRVGEPLEAVVRVRNESRVAGTAPARFHVCTMSSSWSRECTGLDRLDLSLPSIGAAAVFEDTISYVVPESLLSYPDQGTSTRLGVCVDPLDALSTENTEKCARADYSALPNLELACGSSPLIAGGTLAGELTTGSCSLSFDTYVNLYRIDASANEGWRLTLDSFGGPFGRLNMRVITERGSSLGSTSLWAGDEYSFTIATPGVYYLAVHRYDTGAYSIQVAN